MALTHAFKKEQKLLKLCNISKILSMRASAKLQLLVSFFFLFMCFCFEYSKSHLKHLTIWIPLIEDGKLMADTEAGEFWGLFGGFAPLPKKTSSEDNGDDKETVTKLLW